MNDGSGLARGTSAGWLGGVARALRVLTAALLAGSVAPAWAHHSAAVYYLLDKQITVEGIVGRYTLSNPHAQIHMTVTGADGKAQEWLAEGGSRTGLLRRGWTGQELKAGDVVKIVGNPARDGSNVIHWQMLILPDGRQLSGDDPNSADLEGQRRSAEWGAGQ